jgi:SSS family solute:Na+ symporter
VPFGILPALAGRSSSCNLSWGIFLVVGLFVGAYLVGTIIVGLIASRRVHGARDFMVAGRSLPFYMNFACVFATWFGAETVLSISATFTRDGLSGVSGDPFGAGACLMIVGLFFARTFYSMNLLTIGDFFRARYGQVVEVTVSACIALSYLGWASAQMTALGLVINVVGGGALSLNESIVLGAVVVTLYTLVGGMWSVALTDLIQTGAIVVGLLLVAYFLSGEAGGASHVLTTAYDQGKLRFTPSGGWHHGWLPWISAFLTFALGSIPQQDVFQRVTSAKDYKTAVRGTLFGGACYFVVAFIPMFIAFSAIILDPSYTALFASEDGREIQRILPDLILRRTPVWIQVMFFGALVSAILSTASGTILAPASVVTENIVRPFWRNASDQQVLWCVRTVLLLFSIAASLVAVNSMSTMCEMVQEAYKVTLVAAFVPLASGVFWKRASNRGALCSIVCGISVWLFCEWAVPAESESSWAFLTPQLFGLLAAIIGMVTGSLLLTKSSRQHEPVTEPRQKNRQTEPAYGNYALDYTQE